jgi:hypothetical protein
VPTAKTYVTPVSNAENCNNMRYTFGVSTIVKGPNLFTLADHIQFFSGNIYVCHDILPFVLFANEEFVLGSESNPAAFANETNEGYIAL